MRRLEDVNFMNCFWLVCWKRCLHPNSTTTLSSVLLLIKRLSCHSFELFIALNFHLLWRHMQGSYVWCTVTYVCACIHSVKMFVLTLTNHSECFHLKHSSQQLLATEQTGFMFSLNPNKHCKIKVDKWPLWAHVVQKTEFQGERNESGRGKLTQVAVRLDKNALCENNRSSTARFRNTSQFVCLLAKIAACSSLLDG